MTRPREPEDRAGLHAVDVSDVLLHPLSPRERAAFTRTTSERALARYEARRAEITFTNAVLEGSTFTLPEVRILLDGITPEGRRITEVLEVSNLARTVNLLHDDVAAGAFALDIAHLQHYNAALMRGLLLEPGTVRGTGSVHGAPEGIAVNVMGRVFHGYNDTTIAPALAVAHERCSHIEDVVERALNYAALISYVQPFSDGNKRTARFMADGLLMSRGYDAVEIPAASRREYTRALADMFTRADTGPYVEFLAHQARQDSRSA